MPNFPLNAQNALTADGDDDDFDDEPDMRKWVSIASMVRSQINSTLNARDISRRLQNYGCHCFPGMGRNGNGAGPPQDDYDSLCRDLSKCHKCILFDHFTLDPIMSKYRWSLNKANEIVCKNRHPQNQNLCECDAHYATQLGRIWRDEKFDYTIWRNRKNKAFKLDWRNVCSAPMTKHLPGRSLFDQVAVQDCCGTYPYRHPYNLDSGLNCCDDGTVSYMCF